LTQGTRRRICGWNKNCLTKNTIVLIGEFNIDFRKLNV